MKNVLTVLLALWTPIAARLPKVIPVLLGVSFAAVLFFWARGGNFDVLWMQRWAILLAGLALMMSWKVGKNVSWAFAPLTFFTLFSGIATAYWFNRYNPTAINGLAPGVGQEDSWALQAILRQDSSRALFTYLLLTWSLRSMKLTTVSWIRTGLGLMGLIEAVLIIFQPHPSFWVPYFDNPSMGAAFVALALFVLNNDVGYYFRSPDLRFCLRVAFMPIMLMAIFQSHASTPLLALAAGAAGYLYSLHYRERYTIAAADYLLGRPIQVWTRYAFTFAPILAFGIFGVGYLLQGREVIDDNSRFHMWSWALELFYRQNLFTRMFGFGTGTMRALLPLAQVEHGVSTGWFFWLHNDWLQILPEQGWFGFASVILAAAELGRRAWRWPGFFSMLACFGAVMVTGFPLHWPVFVLTLCTIVRPMTEPKEIYPEGIL
jgi:hypothetical protein